jgi:hypothetical protein
MRGEIFKANFFPANAAMTLYPEPSVQGGMAHTASGSSAMHGNPRKEMITPAALLPTLAQSALVQGI